jgi:hypothetical protein
MYALGNLLPLLGVRMTLEIVYDGCTVTGAPVLDQGNRKEYKYDENKGFILLWVI